MPALPLMRWRADGRAGLQQASAIMLSALTPARVSDLQNEIDTAASAITQDEEADFLDTLLPPLAANSTSQPP